MTGYYNQNDCPNPSFEQDLLGYTPLTGSNLLQDGTNAYRGRYSMQVLTTGTTTGQGFYGPNVVYSTPVTATVGIALSGESGVVQVSAVVNPGGVILQSVTVDLTAAWQYISLNNLGIAAGEQLYVLVETPFAQDIKFNVDAIQYVPQAVSPGYIDGNSTGCYWVGAANESASYQLAQNPIAAHGGIFMEGLGTPTVEGEVFQVEATGNITMGGVGVAETVSPVAALDDFAMWPGTDVDPALSYVGYNNANLPSGHTDWSRNWGIFYPPLDYQVSDGSYLWRRAAYMATGFEFASVPAGQAQNITNVQVEMMPIAGTDGFDDTPAPTTYDSPRAIHVIVKPTRLNFCPNPSFETSLANWVPFSASTTLTQDSTVSFDISGEWDGIQYSAGTKSAKSVVSSGIGGLTGTLTNLVVGYTYIASAYVLIGAGVSDIQMTAGRGVSDTLSVGTGDLTPGWTRQFVIFTANASTMVYNINVLPGADVVYPMTFWTDCVLVEAGEILGDYFDGNNASPDYAWETGGTANLTRSYFYEGFRAKQSTVTDILNKHIPFGISYAPPLYNVPYTQ